MMMSVTSEVDDLAEGGADDDAHGQVHDIAARDELSEFLQHFPPAVNKFCEFCVHQIGY